jgi:hypothetical protein
VTITKTSNADDDFMITRFAELRQSRTGEPLGAPHGIHQAEAQFRINLRAQFHTSLDNIGRFANRRDENAAGRFAYERAWNTLKNLQAQMKDRCGETILIPAYRPANADQMV